MNFNQYGGETVPDRSDDYRSALLTLWGELATAMLTHPELTELFLKSDKKLRELGVLPPAYTK